MPLHLRSPEIDELVGELESLLQVSTADAVRFALKNEVARVKAMGRLRLSLAHLDAKRISAVKTPRTADQQG